MGGYIRVYSKMGGLVFDCKLFLLGTGKSLLEGVKVPSDIRLDTAYA
jgi:hypothetical protein